MSKGIDWINLHVSNLPASAYVVKARRRSDEPKFWGILKIITVLSSFDILLKLFQRFTQVFVIWRFEMFSDWNRNLCYDCKEELQLLRLFGFPEKLHFQVNFNKIRLKLLFKSLTLYVFHTLYHFWSSFINIVYLRKHIKSDSTYSDLLFMW